jgi:hypothetical protein
MTTTGGLLSAPRHGFRLWFAVFSGIFHWMVHITACAAIAPYTCRYPNAVWAINGLTALTGAATVVAMYWSWLLVRAAGDASSEESDLDGRSMFLGLFGLLTGAISLLLIIWEGLYVPFLSGCS